MARMKPVRRWAIVDRAAVWETCINDLRTTLARVTDKLRPALAASPAPQETVPEPQRCVWTREDEEANEWATSCGRLWQLIDGDPADNRVKYCIECGKPIEVQG